MKRYGWIVGAVGALIGAGIWWAVLTGHVPGWALVLL